MKTNNDTNKNTNKGTNKSTNKSTNKNTTKTRKTVFETLVYIQKNLKAPKNQFNSFGWYRYRSLEDIVESVKPLLWDCVLLFEDEIVQIGERYYIKSTAILTDWKERVTTSAFAREPINKKWMDEAQITWASSSYARKYALNALFAIDDTKDPDTDEYVKQTDWVKQKSKYDNNKPWYNDFEKHREKMIEEIKKWKKPEDIIAKLEEKYKINREVRQKIMNLKENV